MISLIAVELIDLEFVETGSGISILYFYQNLKVI